MSLLYIIAGERSGDAHGAKLMAALRDLSPVVEFAGAGGPLMRAAGGNAVADWVEEAGVVGLVEVLRNYGYFKREFDRMLGEITRRRPEAVVLIDYPGFNLRMARAIKKIDPGIRVLYYISPQVWAWNRSRIPKMARTLDLMLCIFPFEVELYRQSGLRAEFVGHPLVDELGDAAARGGIAREGDLVGLFPGSRMREVGALFPIMADAAALARLRQPELRFAAAAASDRLRNEMVAILEASRLPVDACHISVGQSRDLMQRAGCGLVASGTATLEAAFLGLPYALTYKVAYPTYLAARMLMRVKHLGIVNILAGREIVREFLQSDANPEKLSDEILRLSASEPERERLLADLRRITGMLGKPGTHARAAAAIAEFLDD
ncbi:MAG: lipid-A-disaccharide synthase [Verrucomicrobiales bacterium]